MTSPKDRIGTSRTLRRTRLRTRPTEEVDARAYRKRFRESEFVPGIPPDCTAAGRRENRQLRGSWYEGWNLFFWIVAGLAVAAAAAVAGFVLFGWFPFGVAVDY